MNNPYLLANIHLSYYCQDLSIIEALIYTLLLSWNYEFVADQ